MDEVAAAVQRSRERADVLQVALDPLGVPSALIGSKAARRGGTNQRADGVAGGHQLAEDVGTDESGGAGQKDAIAA